MRILIRWALAVLLVSGVPASVFGQGFGNDVAIGAGEVLVAEAANQMAPGAVYVYRKTGTGAWREITQLMASDARDGDRFGSAISADGQTLVVGATARENGTGAAYVFQRNASGDWVETSVLTAADGVEGDEFGRSVAIHGDLVLVSSWAHGDDRGAVYVFRRDGSDWIQEAKLMTDVASRVPFGQVLVTDGERIAIGAPLPQFRFGRSQNENADRRGAVYLFHRDMSGAWVEQGWIDEPENTPAPGFSASVAFHGDRIYVTAAGQHSGVGVTYIYSIDETTGNWVSRQALQPFEASGRPQFGAAVAVNGEEVWIGTPGADEIGKVYLFRTGQDGSWQGVSKVSGGSDLESRDRFASALAVRGDLAVASVPGDDFGAGTAVILEREGGEWTARQKVWGEIKGPEAVTGGQVDCTQGVASAFDCDEVDMVAFLPIKDLGGSRGVRLNDIWGWTDQQTGREYAIVGRLDGTSFVDVSNPAQPRYLGNLSKTETSRASTWRDMKVYRDHVFIVADGAGQHGMQIFDLTRLRSVGDEPVEFTETAHYGEIYSAHNIVINEETGFAFAVGSSAGGETCGGGLHMINIQDPASPAFAGCFADPNTGRRGTGYSHDAQCVTYRGPDSEHVGKEICMGANETALSVSDVTDKGNPVALAMATYPNVG
jgi:hypothetical protein